MLRRTLLLSTALGFYATSTLAQEPTARQLQTARDLFHQAEQLEDAKKWDDALDQLHIVEKIKRTAGVIFHIAWCEEHRGNLVKALRGYEEAPPLATTPNAQPVLNPVTPK